MAARQEEIMTTTQADQWAAALDTVEQDHRLVLEKAQALKEAVIQMLDPAEGASRAVLGRLREMDDYFATQFESHMAEEEVTLFPILEAGRPAGPDTVARLRKEHAEIRRKREEFDGSLSVAEQLEDDVPRRVVRDLISYGWELWEALDNHAQAETRAVHQCIAASIQEAGSRT
jgi:hemerythrin-like domain-containing protein